MLRVDVRDLKRGPVPTEATLAPGDPVLAGLDLTFDGPVLVAGVLQGAPEQRTFAWQASIRAAVRGECRRCLAPVVSPVEAKVAVVFSTDPDAADDPGVYPLAEPLGAVDVSPAVREELLLAAPQYALCREECAGLCPRCGADLNDGPCGCAGAPTPS